MARRPRQIQWAGGLLAALCVGAASLAISGQAGASEARPQRALQGGDAAVIEGRWRDDSGITVRFDGDGGYREATGLVTSLLPGARKGEYVFGEPGICADAGNLAINAAEAPCCYYASMVGNTPGNFKLLLRAQPEPSTSCPNRILRR